MAAFLFGALVLFCNHATAQACGGLPNLPESFIIDRHGKIIAKAEMDDADSEQGIEANIRKACFSDR